jgi:hypothetical protein
MPPWLGTVLAALGVFLALGLLTIVGTAVRESGLPPGTEPDAVRRRRARISVALAGLVAAVVLWGGNRWWAAEAASYSRSVLYRPLNSVSAIARKDDRRVLTVSIRDERWTGSPNSESRYNALMPDHGKLMHLFMLREPALDALAHLHPLARSAAGLDFDTLVPALPAGRYRVYADIVHESGYAQTLVSSVEVAADAAASPSATDDDDSSFTGAGLRESATVVYDFDDGSRLVWDRGQEPIASGVERELRFSLRDAAGGPLSVDPYMGMAAHLVVASFDGGVFAHLHPSGSISMAAMQRFAAAGPTDAHAGHNMPLDSQVSVPYAFPRAGAYRLFVQVKRMGKVRTAAFDVEATAASAR